MNTSDGAENTHDNMHTKLQAGMTPRTKQVNNRLDKPDREEATESDTTGTRAQRA